MNFQHEETRESRSTLQESAHRNGGSRHKGNYFAAFCVALISFWGLGQNMGPTDLGLIPTFTTLEAPMLLV